MKTEESAPMHELQPLVQRVRLKGVSQLQNGSWLARIGHLGQNVTVGT